MKAKMKAERFRQKNQKYLIITDSNISLTILGLKNKVINADGWLLVDKTIYKYNGLTRYQTSITNRSEIENGNYSSPNIRTNKIICKTLNKPNLARQINQWGNEWHSIESHHCKRKRRTNFNIYYLVEYDYGENMFSTASNPKYWAEVQTSLSC